MTRQLTPMEEHAIEVESERQELLSALINDGNPENFEPESHGHHEALDRTHVQLSTWSDHIADHPFIVLHPKLFSMSRRIVDLMAELYQEIGQIEKETKS